MSLSRPLTLVVAIAALLIAALPASAQELPASPGDFVIAIDLSGETAANATPTCDPDMITIGAMLAGGKSSVSATCTTSSSVTGKPTPGTASNPTLAATTGDPGFNTGTINATCDATQSVQIGILASFSGTTVQKVSGSAFYACAFTMAFQDAQTSSLTGTIEVNATLGNGDATDTASTVAIAINGTVYVTGGTGVFTGAVGQGTFDQTQTFDIPSASSTGSAAGGSSGGSGSSVLPSEVCSSVGLPAGCTLDDAKAACTANPALPTCAGLPKSLHLRLSTRTGDASTMKLALKKGNGAARILVPGAPAGKPRGTAKVKAKTKVKMAATVGAQCTVKASTGTTVGTATIGAKGTATIRPKAGSYTGATWIKATCTKGGKSFASNKVRISLK